MHTFEFIRPLILQRRSTRQRSRKPRSKVQTCASWEAARRSSI